VPMLSIANQECFGRSSVQQSHAAVVRSTGCRVRRDQANSNPMA
jgi:hypothetical protein